MSIFNEFFKKEKPVFTGITRGLGGFGFGAAAGGGDSSPSVSPDGHTATGGIISDFDDGGTIYRSHTFITPGTFEVTALSTVYPAGIEYLVVAGGGGGGGSGYGSDGQGAGGAGGLRSNHPSVPAPLRGPAYNISATTYTVEVGLGAFGGKHGGGGTNANNNLGRFGKDSNFYPSPVSYPNTAYIRAPGGGRGGAFGSSSDYRDGEPGGSGGGGAGGSAGSAGSGNQPTDPNWPQPVGNPGGARGPNYGAGGGGGFSGPGESADSSNNPGDGGPGINLTMESGTATGYAGGGAGGAGGPGRPDPGSNHGAATHGGGSGGTGRPDALPTYLGGNGRSGSGGGGGGSAAGSGPGNVAYDGKGWGGGDGGPGIVVVRYQIGQLGATAKATGGAVSFYNNKAIHTFRNPGTFTATESLSCEVVLVGGGGGGGYQNAGGGGAGGYRVVTSHPVPAAGHAVTVGEFGVGLGNGPSTSPGPISALRNGGATTLATPSPLSVGGGGAGGNEGPGGGSAQGQVFPGPTGGSSGGGGRHQTSTTTSGPYGNDGANGVASPYVAGGGGGGAGGAGEAGEGPTSEGGHGGLGVQLPTTFRDPNGFKFAQGPDDSYYWVAGGGGGGSGNPGGSALPRGGTGPSGAPSNRCGGGGGGTPYNFSSHSEDRVAPNSQPGMMGTGGGGGGGGEGVGPDPFAGPRAGSPGGSGILLIAYPV